MYQFLWAICYFNVSQPIQCKVTKLRDLLSGGLKQNYLHAEQPPEIHVGLVYFQDNWETISKNDQFEAIPFKTGIAHGHVFPVSFQVYFLYILQPPGYKINHTYYFALFHLFLVRLSLFFLLKVVTSYSHVTEDEAYVFRLQKLCREEKVHNSLYLHFKT